MMWQCNILLIGLLEYKLHFKFQPPWHYSSTKPSSHGNSCHFQINYCTYNIFLKAMIQLRTWLGLLSLAVHWRMVIYCLKIPSQRVQQTREIKGMFVPLFHSLRSHVRSEDCATERAHSADFPSEEGLSSTLRPLIDIRLTASQIQRPAPWQDRIVPVKSNKRHSGPWRGTVHCTAPSTRFRAHHPENIPLQST